MQDAGCGPGSSYAFSSIRAIHDGDFVDLDESRRNDCCPIWSRETIVQNASIEGLALLVKSSNVARE